MRILPLLFIVLVSESLSAQSILDTLTRPNQTAESELQRLANEQASNQANAASKRASLLSRRANELRSQVDMLENKLAELEAEHSALKSAVAEGRDLVLELFTQFEKQDASAIPSQILKIRSFYEKSLQPKLAAKPKAVLDEAASENSKITPKQGSARPAVEATNKPANEEPAAVVREPKAIEKPELP